LQCFRFDIRSAATGDDSKGEAGSIALRAAGAEEQRSRIIQLALDVMECPIEFEGILGVLELAQFGGAQLSLAHPQHLARGIVQGQAPDARRGQYSKQPPAELSGGGPALPAIVFRGRRIRRFLRICHRYNGAKPLIVPA
jgi:hypothetical protein